MRGRLPAVAAVLGVVLTGCGVPPTGVVEAGGPASGLTSGARLYFASAGGLRAVPVGDREIRDLAAVVKLLLLGPPPGGRAGGLTSYVELPGFSATGTGTRVTLHLDGPYAGTGRDQGTGQLVCTLARAQSVLVPGVRTDDVEVVLRPAEDAPLGPYRCAEFLDR
ncbi:hypothetical protein [Streptomyces sp. NRRL S-340]|uniref:hypothetical protein n=1 Tax=Streptomyces sp. NRRL S-340 TaxID=1463901 RepID=UPI00056C5682|nr:hypothetical protein [Streptomyces sp. NRRL S-340]